MPNLDVAREDVPLLLEDVREVNPTGARYIEDVFSEVLRQLRSQCVKDPEMVAWLYESIGYHLHQRS